VLDYHWWRSAKIASLLQKMFKGLFYQFLPRDAVHSAIVRPMPWHGVCLDVYLSCSCVVQERLNVSPKLFTLWQPHLSRLSIQKVMTGSALMGASNAGGVWKNHSFWPVSCLISEAIQDKAIVGWVLWNGNNSCAIYRMVPLSVILNDP